MTGKHVPQPLYIQIHNAKKVTFDGSDCFMVVLMRGGRMIFDRSLGNYDPDSTADFNTLPEAIAYAKDLAKRRGATEISVRRDNHSYEKIKID